MLLNRLLSSKGYAPSYFSLPEDRFIGISDVLPSTLARLQKYPDSYVNNFLFTHSLFHQNIISIKK